MNATETVKEFALDFAGGHPTGKSTMWQFTGSDLTAANRVGEPPQVTVKESVLENVPAQISVPPISIMFYQFPIGNVEH